MLIITRQLQSRQRKQPYYSGGNVLTNIIKSIANKVTAQKVVDAVVDGGVKVAGETAAKGAKLVAESALKRVLPQNNNKKNTKKQKFDTVNALINGSGIIYD